MVFLDFSVVSALFSFCYHIILVYTLALLIFVRVFGVGLFGFFFFFGQPVSNRTKKLDFFLF